MGFHSLDVTDMADTRPITTRAILVGALLSGVFSFVTVYLENSRDIYVTATQIAVLPYLFLIGAVLAINPIFKRLPLLRPLTLAELLVIFTMGAVSAGVSSLNFANMTIATAGALFNRDINIPQNQLDVQVVPFQNDAYFLGVSGTQPLAKAYREAFLIDRDLRVGQRYAIGLVEADEALKAADAEYNEAYAKVNDSPEVAAVRSRVDRRRAFARRNQARALESWLRFAEERPDLPQDAGAFVAMHDAKITDVQADLATKEAAYREVEAEAFAVVDRFRKGLPEDMRSVPGFIKSPDETFTEYFSRINRLSVGRGALGDLQDVLHTLDPDRDEPLAAADVDQLAAAIDVATSKLNPLADPTSLEQVRQQLNEQDASEKAELNRVLAEITATRKEINNAGRGDRATLESRQKSLNRDRVYLVKDQKETTEALETNRKQLQIRVRVQDTIDALTVLKAHVRGETVVEATADKTDADSDSDSSDGDADSVAIASAETTLAVDATAADATADEAAAAALLLQPAGPISSKAAYDRLDEIMRGFAAFDADLSRFLIGQAPWSDWVRPLGRWILLTGLFYVVLMGLNVLVFRQWAHNEKLVYPLAELPMFLAGKSSGDTAELGAGSISPIFRTGLFWAGAGLSGSVLGWNALCMSNVLPGLPRIDINAILTPYINGSVFAGIAPYARFEIIFTVVGLSFIIPANITHSLWLFRVLTFLLLLVLVWLGYGVNESSFVTFPADWYYQFNFQSAIGGGALLVFSSVMLYRCRDYVLCAIAPGLVKHLDRPAAIEMRIFSALFLAASVGVILILWLDMGASLPFVLFFYVIILAITIGLTRAVAEGGLLGFQNFMGPFHLIRTLMGMKTTWAAPTLFAPLVVVYAVLFLDVKAFIAPAMANGLKIRDELHLQRLRFHLSMLVGVLIAGGVAVATHLIMAYSTGANAQSYVVSIEGGNTIVALAELTRTPTNDDSNAIYWLITGGVTMTLLLLGRRKFFWMPHPIGLIMLVNPLMHNYWFSIFLGWLFKVAVTRYSNRDAYQRVRHFFIGLIVGELIVILLSLIVSMTTSVDIRIDLNRNWGDLRG